MDPERNREGKELYWEKRRLSEKIETDLLTRLKNRIEFMPDMINCPNQACRYPLKVVFETNQVILSCSNCEFRQEIKSSTD